MKDVKEAIKEAQRLIEVMDLMHQPLSRVRESLSESVKLLDEALAALSSDGWVSHPEMKQGYWWAIPRFPEDASPEVICVWCDDGQWSFGEQGRPRSCYRKFCGPITEPSPPDKATDEVGK